MQPVDGAEQLPGRYVCPGLVDVHTHLAIKDFTPVGLDEARQALIAARDVGILMVRDLGAPRGIDLRFGEDELLPKVVAAGPWLATEEFFTDDRHDPVSASQLAATAVALVEAGHPWVKVIADWMEPRLTYPFEVLKSTVEAVHAAGGRVAAHTNWRIGDVVAAGVDSVEHGAKMDEVTTVAMAERDVAWVPTLASLEDGIRWASQVITSSDPATTSPKRIQHARHWMEVWQQATRDLHERIPAAVEAGVLILAGPDNSGTLAHEVELLAEYGVPADAALAAASTKAREFLGVPGLAEGAPADVVTYDVDPLRDLGALARPRAVLLQGSLVPSARN